MIRSDAHELQGYQPDLLHLESTYMCIGPAKTKIIHFGSIRQRLNAYQKYELYSFSSLV